MVGHYALQSVCLLCCYYLLSLICVLVARPRRCPTLSNPVPWQNWMAAYLGYTLRMKTLFHGWPVMVHDTHTRRRLSGTGNFAARKIQIFVIEKCQKDCQESQNWGILYNSKLHMDRFIIGFTAVDLHLHCDQYICQAGKRPFSYSQFCVLQTENRKTPFQLAQMPNWRSIYDVQIGGGEGAAKVDACWQGRRGVKTNKK